MMRDWARSLAWRHTRLTLLVAVVLGLGMSLLLIFVDFQQTRENIRESTQELLKTTANAATQAAYTLDATLAEEVLEGLFAVQAVSSGHLITERGRVLANRDRRASIQSPWYAHLLGEELVFTHPLVWHNNYTDERQAVGELRITLNGGLAGSDFIRRVIWELLFGLVRNVVLAFVLLAIAKQLLTRPLSQLAQALDQRREREELKPLKYLPGHERDEIGQVVRAFNELTASLQASQEEKARLNEVMAHHFQEPVRRMAIYAQRLQTKTPVTQAGSEEDPALGFIQEQALRLSHLVRDVQAYLALDQLHLPAEQLDPRQVFDQACSSLAEELGSARIRIHQDADYGVYFSARRLQEIFVQLINNCLKYSLEPVLEIDLYIDGDEQTTRLRLVDNGPGIDPEYRQKVFDIFTRLVPNSSAYPGTGMGLALVKKLVIQYHGQVAFVDSPTQGAAVVLDLPAKEGEKDAESTSAI
ncbi:sensor histidine kinase [Marinospirillum perlucidum]|uniref:sensor histidine kinase n=1 Tax=Marinospirillum perlucidum TaxID=1982602 RepID=UPI000DF41EF9|nr:HAMP domain-containing sensor histidine kinase [Marinospirillum perlucidum]